MTLPKIRVSFILREVYALLLPNKHITNHLSIEKSLGSKIYIKMLPSLA